MKLGAMSRSPPRLPCACSALLRPCKCNCQLGTAQRGAPSPLTARLPRPPGAGVGVDKPRLTYKEAVLTPPLAPPTSPPTGHPSQRPRSFHSDLSLPALPPRFLLNPSLRGRCFRCFARGHRAAQCREPRRCLLCMRLGHQAARCESSRLPSAKEGEGRTGRSTSISAPPPAGQPALAGLVAGLITAGMDPGAIKESLPGKLAGFFGGAAKDYRIASYRNESLAVFFLSWLARESAIERSPLWLEVTPYTFTNWVEGGEERRGHLKHKAWVRLRNWPLLC